MAVMVCIRNVSIAHALNTQSPAHDDDVMAVEDFGSRPGWWEKPATAAEALVEPPSPSGPHLANAPAACPCPLSADTHSPLWTAALCSGAARTTLPSAVAPPQREPGTELSNGSSVTFFTL